jgi:hypothetical protein
MEVPLLESIYPSSLIIMGQMSRCEFEPKWGECKTYLPTIRTIAPLHKYVYLNSSVGSHVWDYGQMLLEST